jgi:hypothetical protein
VQTIADSLNILNATIYTHLVERIGILFFTSFGSPTLTSELQQKRVELAGQLLRVPGQQQRIGFREIVIGDAS